MLLICYDLVKPAFPKLCIFISTSDPLWAEVLHLSSTECTASVAATACVVDTMLFAIGSKAQRTALGSAGGNEKAPHQEDVIVNGFGDAHNSAQHFLLLALHLDRICSRVTAVPSN